MIQLSTDTITDANIYAAGQTFTFAGLPASPAEHQVMIRVELTSLDDAANRTLHVTVRNTDGSIFVSEFWIEIAKGDTDDVRHFNAGPFVVDVSDGLKLTIQSDNSSDTSVDGAAFVFSDDIEATVMDKLLAYVQLLARADDGIKTDRATEFAEINADEGSGAGGYNSSNDAQQYIGDAVEAAASVCTEARLAELAAANLPADIDTLLARITAARAGYWDNLNISENVAGSSEVAGILNNTRAQWNVPPVIERPDADSTGFKVEIYLYDDHGNMEAPDSAPTIAAENQAGTDRSGNFVSTTMTQVGAEVGHYEATYTVASDHAIEQIRVKLTVVEGGKTRYYGGSCFIVDTTAVDFTAADRTKLEAVHTRVPAEVAQKGHLVNGSGDITPPANKGIWDALGDGTKDISGLNDPSAADLKTVMEADGSKLDHLWEMTEDDGGTRRLTTNALEQAPSGGATAQQVWEYATRILTAGGSVSAQVVAQVYYGTNGTVWHVALEEDGGDDDANDGLSWAAPKLTAKTVIEAAASGDVVLVGYGSHDVAADNITQPVGVRVYGCGKQVTTITGARSDSTDGVYQLAGNGGLLAGITIENSSTTQQSVGIKVIALKVTGDHVTVRDVLGSSLGGTGVYWSSAQNVRADRVHGIATRYPQVFWNCQDFIGHDLIGETLNTCTVGAAVGFHFTGSVGVNANRVLLVNPMAYAWQGAQTAAAIGIRVNTGRVHVIGGVVEARSDAAAHEDTEAKGVCCTGLGAGDGEITLVGTRIHTVCDNGTAYDFEQDYSGVIGVDDSVDYATAKVHGTIVNLSDRAAQAALNTALPGSPTAGSLGALVKTVNTCLSGITSLANWLRGLARKDAMDATAKTELNLGGGLFDEPDDSQQGIADGAVGGGATAEEVWGYAARTLTGGGQVTVESPVATDCVLTIYPCDDYNNTDGRALGWTNAAGTWGSGDITDAAVAFRATHKISGAVIDKAGSVVVPTGEQQVQVELTAVETAAFLLDRYDYQVRLTLVSGRKTTIVDSDVNVIKTLFDS